MTIEFNYNLHIFHSPQLQSIVDDALRFFTNTPVYPLSDLKRFTGAGVYNLYYAGKNFSLYQKIAEANKDGYVQPIYVGKAVPPGWRRGRTVNTDTPDLYRRLIEHSRSIKQANNLQVDDFKCQFMILSGLESDLIVPVEATLIRRYAPLWNTVIDGFGNHDPGSGRYNQAKSEWDVLHPGRPWVERLTGQSPDLENIVVKVQQSLQS